MSSSLPSVTHRGLVSPAAVQGGGVAGGEQDSRPSGALCPCAVATVCLQS